MFDLIFPLMTAPGIWEQRTDVSAPGTFANTTDKYDRQIPADQSAFSVITPEFHGANGSGTVDDTLALQAAIDEAANKRMPLFLSGTYRIQKGLSLKSGLHIFGTGTLILDRDAATKALAASPIRMLTNDTGSKLSNVKIEGITLDGNRDLWINSVTPKNRGAASCGLRALHIDGLTIQNVTFKNMMDGALVLSGCTNFRISSNSVTDFYGIGITIGNSNNGLIAGNQISDGHEVFPMYKRTASNGIFTMHQCKNISISGNTISDVTDVGIEIGYESIAPAENIAVTGNLIRSQQGSKKLRSKLASALAANSTTVELIDASAFPESGSVIINNELLTYKQRIGNRLLDVARGSYYTVKSNHADNTTVSVATFPSGIFMIGTIGATVTGNNISECMGTGIRIDKGAKRIAITGNQIHGTYRAIHISNIRDTQLGAEHISIANNVLDARDHTIEITGTGATGSKNHQYITIEGNTLNKSVNANGQTGIKADGTANNRVKGLLIQANHIVNHGYGINLNEVDESSVLDNLIRDTFRPAATNWPRVVQGGIIYINRSSNIGVCRNQLINSRSGAGGIKVYDSSFVTVESNRHLDPFPPATRLNNSIKANAKATTVELADASGFPDPNGSRGYYLMIGSEVFEYTDRIENKIKVKSGERGILGSSDESHNVGDAVYLCSPSIVVDLDRDCIVKGNESRGKTTQILDYSDIGGRSTHIRTRFNSNHAGSGLYDKPHTIKSGVSINLRAMDEDVMVKKTVGSKTNIKLPAVPAIGQTVRIKDGKGDANRNPITVLPAVGSIDGHPSDTLSQPFASRTYRYTGEEWRID